MEDNGGEQWQSVMADDGDKINTNIGTQARKATDSRSGPPVTGTRQPGTNASHQDLKVFLFVAPSTADGLWLTHAQRCSVSLWGVNSVHFWFETQQLRWQLSHQMTSQDEGGNREPPQTSQTKPN